MRWWALGFWGVLTAACSLSSLDELQGAGGHDGGGTAGGAGSAGMGGADASSGGTAGSLGGGAGAGGSAGAGGAPQNVTLDAVTSSFSQNAGEIDLNWSHTVGVEPNRLLVVVVHTYSNVQVGSVSYGALVLDHVGSSVASGTIDPQLHFYRLLGPASGTANLSVELVLQTDAEEAIAAAVSFHHVDQTAPLGALSTAKGSSATNGVPVLDVASANGELVIGAVTHRNNTIAVAVGAGQSELYNKQGASGYDLWGSASSAPGAPTVTLTWSHPDELHWAAGGVSIRPPAPL